MATNKPDGGPVFPEYYKGLATESTSGGRTRRQWYAGLAMQGFLANQNLTTTDMEQIAREAWAMADALLLMETP